MPAPTITTWWPLNAEPYPTTRLRPQSYVAWTGGVGPFDVLHEWDTDLGFGAPLQVTNAGATSPNTAVPPSDLGPGGTTWYYRARVTDTSDSTFAETPPRSIPYFNPRDRDRWLYLLGSVGVGFDADEPGGGWGPSPSPAEPDGRLIDFDRWLYLLGAVGVGFNIDEPVGGWGPSPNPPGGEPDGNVIDFDRWLYLLANIDTTTPTPHIWYLFPKFGEEGFAFDIVGYGFGDTQGTYAGTATLNGLAVGILSWQLVAQSSPDLIINPLSNVAQPVHQLIEAIVPAGATSGLVVVCTDGP